MTFDHRLAYAHEVAAKAGLATTAPVLQALRTVPREASLGPGPWTVQTVPLREAPTLDAAPHHVLHDVAVQLPSGRWQPAPALLASLLDLLAPQRGERAAVVGQDIAYPAALLASLTGAAPLPCELADDAVAMPDVPFVEGPAIDADLLLVLAGCSRPPWTWLEGLRPGGRAVFPLLGMDGTAMYWHVQRPQNDAHDGARWPARAVTLGETAPWDGGPWDANEAALADALAHRLLEARSLLRSGDDGEDMVLVFDEGCISLRP
jgi:protein-L-isoaspartate(D-aspartate) O-methyltransferase